MPLTFSRWPAPYSCFIVGKPIIADLYTSVTVWGNHQRYRIKKLQNRSPGFDVLDQICVKSTVPGLMRTVYALSACATNVQSPFAPTYTTLYTQ